MIKNILIVLLFYVMVLMQVSFCIHLGFIPASFSFILVALLLLAVLEGSQMLLSVSGAISAGFFWDIFSSTTFIGFYTLILLGFVIFIKLIVRKHFQLPAYF